MSPGTSSAAAAGTLEFGTKAWIAWCWIFRCKRHCYTNSPAPISHRERLRWICSANIPEEPVADTAQQDNVYTRYYVYAGIGPQGQKTLTLRYCSASDHVRVLVMLTAIEELQIGVGDDAQVYEIDQTTGETIRSDNRAPITDVPSRAKYVSLIESFGKS